MTSAKTEPLLAALRPRLIRLAYRYLGRVADAEDLVQEAFLKLTMAEDVRKPEAWLARAVTTGAIDRLRREKARREDYVGQWLPEPLIEDGPTPADRELDISFAVMRTLEALSPLERAAFFLHDLFDQDFATIGQTLQRTPIACRKLASRARAALSDTGVRRPASEADLARLLDALSQAAVSGDVAPLTAILAEDAELISDGGGRAIAAPNVIRGALAVALFLEGIARKRSRAPEIRLTRANGGAALILWQDGQAETLLTLDLDVGGLVRGIYLQRNPDKLQSLRAPG